MAPYSVSLHATATQRGNVAMHGGRADEREQERRHPPSARRMRARAQYGVLLLLDVDDTALGRGEASRLAVALALRGRSQEIAADRGRSRDYAADRGSMREHAGVTSQHE